MSPVDGWQAELVDGALDRLQDSHCGLIIAVRSACVVLDENYATEGGALRCAETALAEAINDLMAALRPAPAPRLA